MAIFDVIVGAIGLGADFGLTSLIGNVAATVTTKTGNKLIDKITIGLGTAVLAGMAGEAAQNYIEKKANELRDAVVPEYMRIEDMSAEDEFDVNFDDDFFVDEDENEPEIACGED